MKIEGEVASLPGVKEAVIDLISQKLTVKIDQDGKISYEQLLQEITRLVQQHEPDVKVLNFADNHKTHTQEEHHHHHHHHGQEAGMKLIRLLAGGFLFLCGLIFSHFLSEIHLIGNVLLMVSYLLLGYDVIFSAARNILKGRVFDENFLMSLSTLCALAIGELPEAVAVMLFYQVGEFAQDLAVDRSRKSISSLMDLRPDTATCLQEGKERRVDASQVQIGDILVLKPGEKLPLDGVIVEGNSSLDTRALTGESLPKTVSLGDEVLSGSVNLQGRLLIRVTRNFSESTAGKIMELVENASSQKAPTERFITKFARYYTPVVVILALLLAILPPLFLGGNWPLWLHRACVFLVISCPCALVISVPLAFFGGIGAASGHGVLIKGGNHLESLAKLDTVVFDKTGTLTHGNFEVSGLFPAKGYSEEELLRFAVLAEEGSDHPIARSVKKAFQNPVSSALVHSFYELPGLGVEAVSEEGLILVGNEAWMQERKIDSVTCSLAGTKVYVAKDGQYLGCVLVRDQIKKESILAVEKLRHLGVRNLVMLTGDEEAIAAEVAKQLGLDAFQAGLLPQEKVAAVEKLLQTKRDHKKLAFVGDGINDAPVLALSDVGIAMGGLGSDAAIEAADVVLMTDDPAKLPLAITLARETEKIVWQNILFALGAKGLLLILGAFGLAGMWLAVFGDVGVALLAVCNSMRVLKK